MKKKMKMPRILLPCILCLTVCILCLRIIGPVYSSSAVSDLTEALESVYGPEYTGKKTENGTEDMRFEIEAKSVLRSWKLHQLLGMDYRYECRVVITTHASDGSTQVRTIAYQAADPMGQDEMYARATIDWNSRQEQAD